MVNEGNDAGGKEGNIREKKYGLDDSSQVNYILWELWVQLVIDMLGYLLSS